MTGTRKWDLVVFILLGLGIALLLLSTIYYTYGFLARSTLDKLNYSEPRPVPTNISNKDVADVHTGRGDKTESIEPVGVKGRDGIGTANVSSDTDKTDDVKQVRNVVVEKDGYGVDGSKAPVQTVTSSTFTGVNKPAERAAPTASTTVAFTFKNTGELNPLKSDDLNPTKSHRDTSGGPVVYEPLAALQAEAALYAVPGRFESSRKPRPPTRIRIPAIRVDSAVDQLEIVRLSDSYAWQTPDNVVGHIPTTASPGEIGQGWYFGHLESPIKGEGNVFSSLPGITSYLDAGQVVYIFIENADRKYLYQIYKAEVVHQDALKITDSGKADITLVTCVPRLFYDHRLLVTAALVGVKEF